ncbi:MAG: metallophosphoesterase [Clostridia bacterium]|nr:metallophosphoesterase [Clostridia bacterium]
MAELKFLVLGDLHYKKKMYAATTKHLDEVLKAANDEKVNFCVHLGDFCNDYKGSPEIVKKYIDNEYGLSVFGVYGNHELESTDNSMQRITPLLSNRTDKLVYGTESKSIEDGSIGYSYYDTEKFRLIFLDTNYSATPDGKYEHNRTKSWGKPKENTLPDSLGDEQITWLKNVLFDAADKSLKCIVFSHASFSGEWNSSPDAEAVRGIFAEVNAKREKTVVLAINGHYHSNHNAIVEGVCYFDCPAAINAIWKSRPYYPYAEQDSEKPKYTFDYLDYDEDGNLIGSFEMPYSSLSMGAQTLFFDSPLYAIVTVTDNGKIKIEGRKTEYAYGISVDHDECYNPEIKNFEN